VRRKISSPFWNKEEANLYNYNKKDLSIVATETGFIRDNLEKVFRLRDILQYLNSNPETENCLSLKGGTAINMIIFNLPRLSVDIDLDFSKECGREEMIQFRENINNNLLNYLFAQGYALSPNTKNPHSLDSWVFYFQNAGGCRDNIKIEINYSMRNHVLPTTKKKINVIFLRVEGEWNTLSTLELFGGKIKALIERTAPRDLYDVNNMLVQNIFGSADQEMLRKIVLFYLVIGGKNKPSINFDFSGITDLKFIQIKRFLIPVLRKNEPFDFDTAKTRVKEYLIKLMQLTDNEKLFVENFNNGIYQPELLFDDEDIIKRIKKHPMAIWRTNKKG
jgi:predicted nucleotidyltransferase component of viral defense system